MAKSLEKQKHPKVTEEEIENLNRSIVNKEIKLVIKKQLTEKSLGSDSFTVEFLIHI